MVAQTRIFGEITIEDEKVLDFPNGIIGIEDKHKYAIVYDVDKGADSAIRWLQSMEDPYLALPVLEPFAVLDEYNPMIDDNLLEAIGSPKDEDIIVLLTIHSIIRLVLLDMLQYQVIIMPGGDLSPPGMQR